MTPETNIESMMAEPPDGTMLVLIKYNNEPIVVWRNDKEARRWDGLEMENWFSDDDTDPMCWEVITQYAIAVHSVSTDPIVKL